MGEFNNGFKRSPFPKSFAYYIIYNNISINLLTLNKMSI
jgi:hypothetical protein